MSCRRRGGPRGRPRAGTSPAPTRAERSRLVDAQLGPTFLTGINVMKICIYGAGAIGGLVAPIFMRGERRIELCQMPPRTARARLVQHHARDAERVRRHARDIGAFVNASRKSVEHDVGEIVGVRGQVQAAEQQGAEQREDREAQRQPADDEIGPPPRQLRVLPRAAAAEQDDGKDRQDARGQARDDPADQANQHQRHAATSR